MVHQDILFFPQLSVLENIIVGFEKKAAQARTEAGQIQDSLGLSLDLDRQASELPFARRQQIELVRLLYRGAEVLILDEPTSLLSPEETKKFLELMKSLREGGRTILFISHRLGEVFSVADKITVLRKGCLAATLDTCSTGPGEIAGLMVGGRLDQVLGRAGDPGGSGRRTCAADLPVLELREVDAKPAGTEPALRDISMSIAKGEIFGIAGIVGNGQRSLARVLAGKTRPDKGSVRFEGAEIRGMDIGERLKRGIRWLPENPAEEALLPGRPIWENFLLGRQRDRIFSRAGFIRGREIIRFSAKRISLDNIAASGPFESISALSGGNRQKVALARVLAGHPCLAILEQPCRGLDLQAAGNIHGCLVNLSRSNGVSFVVISYDFDELISLCDRIAVIYRGEFMGIAEGAGASRELLGRWAGGVREDRGNGPGAVMERLDEAAR
jgi:simple sugar transport system ATP-binding protein